MIGRRQPAVASGRIMRTLELPGSHDGNLADAQSDYDHPTIVPALNTELSQSAYKKNIQL